MAVTSALVDNATRTGSTGTTSTVSGASFGSAFAGRVLVVFYITNGGVVPSAATIGGVSATLTNFPGAGIGIASAVVPTGTSGNIVFTLPSSDNAFTNGVVALTGASNATPSDTIAAASTSGNIDVGAGGALVAGAYAISGSGSWTGVTGLRTDSTTGITLSTASFDNSGGALTNRTVSYTTANVIMAAAFDASGGGGGTQNLTPSLFSDGDTFFTPTVGRGAVGLTPSLFADADTFRTQVLTSRYPLTPALYADADTFFTPAITTGAVNLTPSLYADADTFFTATVSPGTVNLAPGLYVDADTFYTPTISATYTITPSLFSDADSFYNQTVSAGAVNLVPGLYSDPDAFFVPTVSQGGTVLLPPLFVDGDTFYSATVAPGAVNLSPSLFTDGDTFYSPTVTASYSISPSLFTDSDTFFAPTVSQSGATVLLPDLFVNQNVFYLPQVQGGATSRGDDGGGEVVFYGKGRYEKTKSAAKRKIRLKETLQEAINRAIEELERKPNPVAPKAIEAVESVRPVIDEIPAGDAGNKVLQAVNAVANVGKSAPEMRSKIRKLEEAVRQLQLLAEMQAMEDEEAAIYLLLVA